MEERAASTSPLPAGGAGLDGDEERLTAGKVALQFFVIPMLIVAFCVGIVFLFRWLTYEPKDVDHYLALLRQGTGEQRAEAARNLFEGLVSYIPEAKRWQGIHDMSQRLRADKERFLREHPGFTRQIVEVFEQSRGDGRTRRYLAMTLGLIGDEQATATLVRALGESEAETVLAAVLALGNILDRSALPALVGAAQHPDPGVRQAAVYVLGLYEDRELRHPLEAALNDPDELVTWNAAFALARQGSAAGEKVLTRLLDFDYVSARASLTVGQRQQYRVAAIQQLARLEVQGAVPHLERLTAGDPDMPVRQAAIEALRVLRK